MPMWIFDVYISVSACVCMYVRAYVCTCIYLSMHTYIYTLAYVYTFDISIYICTYMDMHVIQDWNSCVWLCSFEALLLRVSLPVVSWTRRSRGCQPLHASKHTACVHSSDLAVDVTYFFKNFGMAKLPMEPWQLDWCCPWQDRGLLAVGQATGS